MRETEEEAIRSLRNAARVVECNSNGQHLMYGVIQRNAEESRKLYPNKFPDAPLSASLALVPASKDLAHLLRYDNLIVAWIVEEVMALHMAVPAIQVVDLTGEPMVRSKVESAFTERGHWNRHGLLSPAVAKVHWGHHGVEA